MSDETHCFECRAVIPAGVYHAGGRFMPQCLDCAIKEARQRAQDLRQQYMSAQDYLDDLEKRRAVAVMTDVEGQ